MHPGDPSSSSPAKLHEKDPTLPSSGASTPPSEPGASATHLPLHAGFDFNAIKEVLGKAELNPEELKVRDNPYEAPHIPPPTNRSESVPPLRQSSPQVTRSSLDSSTGAPVPGPSSTRADLPASFSRTLSLNDVHDDDTDSEEENYAQHISSYRNGPEPSHEDTSFASTPRPSHLQMPSPDPFTKNDVPSWTPSAAPAPFSFGASPTYGSPFSSPTAQSAHNPFGSFATPDPGLSFGSTDGSITSLPTTSDPWKISNDFGKKKESTFNSNPWS